MAYELGTKAACEDSPDVLKNSRLLRHKPGKRTWGVCDAGLRIDNQQSARDLALELWQEIDGPRWM